MTNEHTDGPGPPHAGSLAPLVKARGLRDDIAPDGSAEKACPGFAEALSKVEGAVEGSGRIRLGHYFDSARQSSDTLLLAERALDDR